MKLFGTLSAALLLVAGAALAETAPDEVAFEEGQVAAALTETAGDAAAGRDWFADRKLGNCLACHANGDLAELPFHGEVGPPLDGVGSRWSKAELRAILIDSKQVFGEGTIMPAFYRATGYNRILEDFEGKTILTAQQVEDVLAYLQSLQD